VDQDWRNRTRGDALWEKKKRAAETSRGASIRWLAGENPLARPAEAMASGQTSRLSPPIK